MEAKLRPFQQRRGLEWGNARFYNSTDEMLITCKKKDLFLSNTQNASGLKKRYAHLHNRSCSQWPWTSTRNQNGLFFTSETISLSNDVIKAAWILTNGCFRCFSSMKRQLFTIRNESCPIGFWNVTIQKITRLQMMFNGDLTPCFSGKLVE